MFKRELRLLGGVTIQGPDGRPLAGRVRHRHRVALLALLAVARASGVRRDKLIGLLWPERDEQAARQLLRAAIHDLRSGIGPLAILATGDELCLDPQGLWVDIHLFEDALAAGDRARAVSLYRGPFADGLFLDDAEEFDSWLTAQRDRFARRQSEAVEALAVAAESAGDHREAAALWRDLVARAPSDSGLAMHLANALAAAGDRGGAAAHLADHAALLRAEYGVPAPRALTARLDRLRRDAVSETGGPTHQLSPPTPSALAPTVSADSVVDTAPTAAVVSAAAVVRGPVRTMTAWRRATQSRAMAGFGLAFALAALGGAWALYSGPGIGRVRETLAVAPFDVVAGAPPELRTGLPDLLTANLDQIAEVRTIPARASAARAAALAAGGDASVPRLAKALGSDGVVTGVVAAVPGGVRVSASLVDPKGVVLARVDADGTLGDLPGLVDQLSVGLLREVLGRRWRVPAPRLVAVSTRSPRALLAYIRGEAFLRAAEWDSSAAAFAAAVDDDSTFSLANLRLAEADGWRNALGSNAALAALAAAERFRSRLPPREQARLAVRRLHEAGDLRALDSANAFAARYPDDPDAQYLRADSRMHSQLFFGAMALDATAAAFDIAIAADPRSARVLTHPFRLAVERGDRARFDAVTARLDSLARPARPASAAETVRHGPDYALLRAVRWGRPADAFRLVVARLHRGPIESSELDELLKALERTCFEATPARPDLMLTILDSARAVGNRSADALAMLAGHEAKLLVGLGLLGRARARLDAFWASGRGGAPGLAVMPVVFGYAPPAWIATDIDELRQEAARAATPLHRRIAVYWRAVLLLASGDSARARADLSAAVANPAAGDSVPHGLAFSVRAAEGWLLLLAADTTRAMHMMRSGLEAAGYGELATMLGGPIRAQYALLEAEDPRLRGVAVDRLRLATESWEGFIWAWWRLALGRALTSEGSAPAAAADWQARFEALWSVADPSAREAAHRRR